MTIGGWIVMILSVGGVTSLLAWCIYKVLTTPGESERLHGFDLNPPDQEEEGLPN